MFDLAILGGGAAGASAAIYAARRGLSIALFEHAEMGGIINTTPTVENYLGFPSASGRELGQKFAEHVAAYPEIKVLQEEVTGIQKKNGTFTLKTDSNSTHEAKTVIFATGAAPRQLGVPGEKEFSGKGVSYCATCDAPLFKGKRVAVVGGGDSGLTAALLLADLKCEVFLIHHRKTLKAEEALVDRARGRGNVKFLLNKNVAELKGGKFLEKLVLQDAETKKSEELEVKGLFVYIGHAPASELAKKLGCKIDEHGFIEVNTRLETSVPGVFAAGDVRKGSIGQLIASAADGAIAALSAAEHVHGKPLKGW